MRLVSRLVVMMILLAMSAGNAVAQGTPVATPEASPVTGGDQEIAFESGPDTLYGSLRVPAGLNEPAPGVLIISGSGPTDRNGDAPGVAMGTNRHMADELEALGVVSFRYDKVGSGETGMASHGLSGEGVDYELFLQGAWDAFDTLASQPEVDPERIIVIGHSEGALFALDMAADDTREVRPAGLILAAPLGVRYLDLIHEQIGNVYAAYVEATPEAEAEAEELMEEFEAAIAEIRETGELTTQLSDPAVGQLLNPANVDFFYQADQRDPAELAAGSPTDMPVLILHGEKDEQVTTEHVDRVEQAFLDAGHDDVARVDIADANHIFQVIEGEPNAALDYGNEDLPFHPEIGESLEAYMAGFAQP